MSGTTFWIFAGLDLDGNLEVGVCTLPKSRLPLEYERPPGPSRLELKGSESDSHRAQAGFVGRPQDYYISIDNANSKSKKSRCRVSIPCQCVVSLRAEPSSPQPKHTQPQTSYTQIWRTIGSTVERRTNPIEGALLALARKKKTTFFQVRE